MKIAVAYVTKGGATADYAEIVAGVLSAAGQDVTLINLKKDKKPDLGGFDAVVVGTGVRIAMVYRRAKKFLRREDLRGKHLAIFLSSGIAIEDEKQSKEKFLEPLVRKYGLEPIMFDAFPGLTPGAESRTPITTDPMVAKRWAETLAEKLQALGS